MGEMMLETVKDRLRFKREPIVYLAGVIVALVLVALGYEEADFLSAVSHITDTAMENVAAVVSVVLAVYAARQSVVAPATVEDRLAEQAATLLGTHVDDGHAVVAVNGDDADDSEDVDDGPVAREE